jgi:phosphatidylglycerol---prolipoprotein diacylglyceryl transferase
MIPYIHIGSLNLPTFGLMLWCAAVAAGVVLHYNFKRKGIQADALNIVALVTVAGILGAKLWHELEQPAQFFAAMSDLGSILHHHPATFPAAFIDWAQAGFAWFGGLVAGIIVLLWQGYRARIAPLSMLDLAAPSAALGYGIGRIGCHLSGDGDYGIPTNLPWAVSYPRGLVPTTARVHPTPIYEFIFGVFLAWYLWWRGKNEDRVGRITGEYLFLSGLGRFLVEFIRINPKVFLGMTNAQLASVGSMAAGLILIAWSARKSARKSSASHTRRSHSAQAQA